jgi:hypothetical protein
VVYKDGSNNPAGSANMTFDGTTLTVNALTESSALKYKENILPLYDSLENLKKVQGVSFVRKGDQNRQLGFIADEIYKIFPELVNLVDGEVDSVYYQRITAVLVEAIKELSIKVEAHETILNGLLKG